MICNYNVNHQDCTCIGITIKETFQIFSDLRYLDFQLLVGSYIEDTQPFFQRKFYQSKCLICYDYANLSPLIPPKV